eukprot:TRINITY_DN4981_c1_g1_i1.p1 TRINITY_DN4981_c1_g1~~TRINITY_DN4981_c1_g1_i1.p1  ORF type:complete len:190 (+),score=18.72 TRINITY_DN4981_c1_g1_i1:89-658(+)
MPSVERSSWIWRTDSWPGAAAGMLSCVTGVINRFNTRDSFPFSPATSAITATPPMTLSLSVLSRSACCISMTSSLPKANVTIFTTSTKSAAAASSESCGAASRVWFPCTIGVHAQISLGASSVSLSHASVAASSAGVVGCGCCCDCGGVTEEPSELRSAHSNRMLCISCTLVSGRKNSWNEEIVLAPFW